MQVDIKDTQIFQNSLKSLNYLENSIRNKVNFIFNQLQKKQDKVKQELTVSKSFLHLAKINEMQKQAILIQKSAELAKAFQQEAAAVSSGNPLAIAAATSYLAQKVHEEMVAQKEFQQARQNRISMKQRVELVNKAKQQIDILYEQTRNQLNSTQAKIISLTQTVSVRLTKGDTIQKDYLDQNNEIDIAEAIYKNIPQSGGTWSGEVGDSIWKPNKDTVAKQPYGNGKTWGEILEKYNIEGIEFKNGEPDFTIVSEGSVSIEDFTIQRDNNFRQADIMLAKNWNKEKQNKDNWTAEDIKKYRKGKKLTWHERSDMKDLDLVPQEIHGNIPHTGGISKKKKLEKGRDNA